MFLWNVPANSPDNNHDQVLKTFERVSFFYAFGPFLSATGVSLLFYGRSGLKSLFKPLLKWRVRFIWYVWALAIPVITQWIALGICILWTKESLKMPSLGNAVQMWLLTTPIIAIFIITEETGWRAFALPRLQSLGNALTASLILGALWSFWHYPLEATVEQGYGEPAVTIVLSLAIFSATTMLFATLMTWIFNSSGGSLLLMLLMHGSSNANLINIMGMRAGGRLFDLPFRISYMISLLLIVGLVLLRYGIKFVSKSGKAVFESPLNTDPYSLS
jgi:membrane protease YdiL (CAAX protease family)